MKKLITKNLPVLILSIILIITTSIILFAYPTGYTGRTLKTSTLGCGSCHTHNSAVSGVISGPDTVAIGTTVQYTLTISDASRTHAGLDVAVRLGTLDPAPSATLIKLVSGELTHQSSLSMTNHTISIPFSYTAPTIAGIDTVWATVTSGTPAWEWAPSKRVIVSSVLGIEKQTGPVTFKLNQNYPNPFNPKTTISFSLPKEENVTLRVYDLIGNEVDNLFEGKLASGKHEISWSADNFASGIYFYTLHTDNVTMTKKMILAK
jgi:hypothetical protein